MKLHSEHNEKGAGIIVILGLDTADRDLCLHAIVAQEHEIGTSDFPNRVWLVDAFDVRRDGIKKRCKRWSERMFDGLVCAGKPG